MTLIILGILVSPSQASGAPVAYALSLVAPVMTASSTLVAAPLTKPAC